MLIKITTSDSGDTLIEREVDGGARAALGIEHDRSEERLDDTQPSRQQIRGHEAWVQAVNADAGSGHAARERERMHNVGEFDRA